MPPLNLTNASTLKDLETVFGFLIQSVLALAGVVFFIMLISTSIVQAGFFDFLTGWVVTKSYIS